MEEKTKNNVIIALSALLAVFLALNFKSCLSSGDLNKKLQSEMAARITAEEQFNRISNEKNGFEEQLRLYQKAVDEEKNAHDKLKSEHIQILKDNDALKSELAKMQKLREDLEKDLKDALAKVNAAQTEK